MMCVRIVALRSDRPVCWRIRRQLASRLAIRRGTLAAAEEAALWTVASINHFIGVCFDWKRYFLMGQLLDRQWLPMVDLAPFRSIPIWKKPGRYVRHYTNLPTKDERWWLCATIMMMMMMSGPYQSEMIMIKLMHFQRLAMSRKSVVK